MCRSAIMNKSDAQVGVHQRGGFTQGGRLYVGPFFILIFNCVYLPAEISFLHLRVIQQIAGFPFQNNGSAFQDIAAL